MHSRVKYFQCADDCSEPSPLWLGSYDILRLPACQMPRKRWAMLLAEGALLLACPLNKDLFGFRDEDFVDIVMKADTNLTF